MTDDPSATLIVGGILAVVALFVVREVAAGALREAGEDLWEWIKRSVWKGRGSKSTGRRCPVPKLLRPRDR